VSTLLISTAHLRSLALGALTAAILGAPALPSPTTSRAPAAPAARQDDKKAEYDKRLAEAEGSVEKLWKVYDWCDSRGMEKEGRSVLRKILKLDDNDRKAHELLGEIFFDGKWFANEKKVEEYKKKQLEDEAKKSGKVVFKGELVDPADLPFLERGMKKLDNGQWVSAEDHQRILDGWTRQDFTWISPEEEPNVKKGLWKCGDKWLTLEEADKYHSELGKWWKVPSDYFVVYSTCPRAIVDKIFVECDRAYREFNRVLGKTPTGKVPVLVLNSADQYNKVASGDLGQPVELRPFSSLYGATIAEVWSEPLQEGMTSAGLAYWNSTNADDNNRGPVFVRHAAGQALAEALDPSPKTLQALAGGRAPASAPDDWWKEKQFPQWFRYGAVSYVERYLQDQYVGSGGNPNWIRDWSKGNIVRVGGLDALDKILACELSLDKFDDSTKLLNETGLLMHFILDGKCAPVVQAHQALKAAYKAGKDTKAAFKELDAALRKSEADFKKFAGI